MQTVKACVTAMLMFAVAALCAEDVRMKEVLREDFSGDLTAWGLDKGTGTLSVDRGEIIVPVYEVSDAVIEYRAVVHGEGIINLIFRYDYEQDLYYMFRVDTRTRGGNPPGFLKRDAHERWWHLVGQRTGKAPAPEQWVKVKVIMRGSKFEGYVDGKLVATYEDSDYKVGRLAFRPELCPARIDDFRLLVPEGVHYRLPKRRRAPKPPPAAPFTQGQWHAHWIWSPGKPDELVRFFRKSFEVPEAVREATLYVTCDNVYELFLNGKLLGKDEDWRSLERFDVKDALRVGRNVLAARCKNDGPGAAGLLLEMGVITASGQFLRVFTDTSWRVAKSEEKGWRRIEFRDEKWPFATSFGKHPSNPWASQSNLVLGYLGPKEPLELLDVRLPTRAVLGQTVELEVTWRTRKKLSHDYPIVVSAAQGAMRPVELATLQPRTPTTRWRPGAPHKEVVRFTMWPAHAYFFDPGQLRLSVEVCGTFYTNRETAEVGALTFEKSTTPSRPVFSSAEPSRSGEFLDPQGRRHEWRLDQAGRIVIDGVAFLPIEGSDGVYYCEAKSAGRALDATDWRSEARRIVEQGGPRGADFVRVRLVDHIDCTKEDHEFSEDSGLGGLSRVVKIGDRRYRLTSARRRLSYYAYTARCRKPRNAHLMMFQTVNDRERYTTLRIQPPWDNVGGGVYTGREYPCDGKPINHMFIFYPRAERIRFTISRWPVERDRTSKLNGAACSHVWLFELIDPLNSRPAIAVEPKGAKRRIGIYLTHPRYLYTLYGFRDRSPDERRASLRSFIDYMKFCGLNLLEFNAVDGGDTTSTAYYKSNIWRRAPGDLLEELLPLCAEADIQLVPIVTSLSVPEGKFGFTRDSFLLDRDGKTLTRFFGSRPPLPDPLRPEVQKVLLDTLREILEICGKHAIVPAVGFRVNGKIGLCFGGATLGHSDQYTGYSKWDIEQFEKDTGIDVPDMKPTPYEWLKAHCWERWIAWRCERTRDLWLKCRDLVRSYRGDLKLYVSCDMPSETPAWNIYWPSGISPLECMRYHGVDPRMFRNEPGILLHRGMMIAADRYFTYSGQYAKNVEAMKTFHYAPGVAEMYGGREGAACEFYHNYWEEFGVAKSGEFRTQFWGAATMYPYGRYYFEPAAFSLARTNCHTMAFFSWERGSYGHEHDLKRFARAFRAIPRGKGADALHLVAGDKKDLWVREFGDRLAILNNSPRPREVTVRYPRALSPGHVVVELGAMKIVAPASATARRPEIHLRLAPYDLLVLSSCAM